VALSPLPIDGVLPAIVEALRAGPNVVVRAPPGAGKTTRVPPALLDAGLVGPRERVIMLQPRRIAARAAARRIAEERGVEVGGEVGYQIRFEDRTSARTRIAILTEGLLTRKLQTDPTLEGVGCVILDEFHERSIHADLGIAFLREIQETLRPELKIVVMSATLETQSVARFLGDAPIVDSPGRTFPVSVTHLETADERHVVDQVVGAVKRVLRDPADDGGDVLVFLPGAGEIRRAEAELLPLTEGRIDVFPLYGELEGDAQDRALRRGSRRKIVLATNIAETSLTIDGVTVVIDSGLARVLKHDPARGGDRLDLTRISRASADQRKGRAGRTRPGRVLRLWTEPEELRMPLADTAEITRVDLAPVLLDVIAWSGKDPRGFAYYERPPTASLDRALATLEAIGAVEPSHDRLTALGGRLRALPTHPRMGAALVEAKRLGIVELGAAACAVASERDFVRRTPERSATRDVVAGSDLHHRVELLGELEASRFSSGVASRMGVDAERARAVAKVRDRFIDLARRALPDVPEGKRPADEEAALGRALLAGFSDRVARRRAPGSDRYLMVGGRGVRLAPESVVKDAELVLCVDLDDSRREAESLVRWASVVERAWLAPRLERRHVYRFVPEREAIEAATETRYLDVVLDESVDTRGGDVDAMSAALAEAALADLGRALSFDDDLRQLELRLELARRHAPEANLPTLDANLWAQVLPTLAHGKRSFAELRAVRLVDVLRAELGHAKLAELERLCPERFDVPSGSRVALRYEPGGPPVLSVRLQEIFGMAATPKICRGRVALKLELLGPNFRPVQVTQDLDSFWDGTYAEVRRELRARYPKHSWPDDPRTAPPQRKPGRRPG
jgi:ATP-dependent helicase HrpB